MTSIFNTSWEYPRMHVWCKFGDSSLNLWLVIEQTSQISQSFKSKWPKLPWRSGSMTSIFNTSQEYPRMYVWCKYGDSRPNLWWVIVCTKKSLWTDRRTDGWMDRRTSLCMNKPTTWCKSGWVSRRTDAGTTIPLLPERPRDKNCFSGLEIPIIKITWSLYSHIFIMGIPILLRQHFYIDELVKERRNSIANWSYVFLALTHQYKNTTKGFAHWTFWH